MERALMSLQWLQIPIILMSSRIRIRIKAKSWIRIRIKVMQIRKLCLYAVLRIQIRRIRMFLDLLDPDPVERGTDPDPSIIKQKW
jgi:uncharacterized membrane protein